MFSDESDIEHETVDDTVGGREQPPGAEQRSSAGWAGTAGPLESDHPGILVDLRVLASHHPLDGVTLSTNCKQ